ncbi:MAG: purine-nucleoside phosphorylase [Candidatus Latescibacterota bacterium]|nr:MAG: purine-nucleoside phosphorylase [Candidatus Latescibacterota bacterium]
MTQKRHSPVDTASLEGASLGVLLGSGLDGASRGFPTKATVSFHKIPGLATVDVKGHKGELKRGVVAGKPCLFICGRKHYYEGGTQVIQALIRFVRQLGVRDLLLTSAAGSLLKSFYPGELVLVDDIIDIQFRPSPKRNGPPRPAAGPCPERPGGKQPLKLDASLSRRVWVAASSAGVALGRGTVAACPGPVYETPSEIRALQTAGASLVTMSGAPEVASANAVGIRVAMLALVTNWASGISRVKLRHDDVLAASSRATPSLRRLITQFAEMS